MNTEQTRYTVQSKKTEVPGVVTLFLSEAGAVPVFIAGQYINVYFPEAHTPEGKAYSISSAPGEPTFSITVRAIGEFSNRLCTLEPGDTINASLPYGFFYTEEEKGDLVLVAAGIGVAPFCGMLRDAAVRTPQRRITLFHSVRTASDAIFQKEFRQLQKKLPNLSIRYFVTREDTPALPSSTPRRMEAKDIVAALPDITHTEFLICGSIPFTRDLWRGLNKAGVDQGSMYTEAFFSH